MTINTNISWTRGSYELDRFYFLRAAENPNENLNTHYDGVSIAIGYGYDLLENYETVTADFAQIGINLTNTQKALIHEARVTPSRRLQITSELNLSLASSSQAKELFNIAVTRIENSLTRILNNSLVNLVDSTERIAILSMIYNGRYQDYDKINFPVKSALNATLAIGDRAEAWFVIRYLGSHAKNPIFADGYAKRAYWESETFTNRGQTTIK